MNSTPASVNQQSSHDGSRLRLDNEIFISYSRKDQSFVKTLDAALRQLNRNPWVDWDDIHKGEEWWAAIQRGIEGANTFIFVVSPDSVASSVCRDEIEHAVKHNKRLLPILRREGFAPEQLHPAIASHNWLFFREIEAFNSAFSELIQAIDTDLDYVRAHTRLLVRAIEWQTKAQNQSRLLRGIDLDEAKQWLVQGNGKDPQPTALHVQYIEASLQAETAQLRARQKAKWIVSLTTVAVNMVLVIAGCSWFYNYVTEQSWQRVQENLESAFKAGLIGIDGDDFEELSDLDDDGSPMDSEYYQEHQDWLHTVHAAFPRAVLRTYIQAEAANEIIWIGDSSRATQTVGIQALGSYSTQFNTSYSPNYGKPRELEDMSLSALGTQISEAVNIVITQPYTDEFGTWVSAYGGPIRDSDGEAVGGLRVDFREDYVRQVQQDARQGLMVIYVISFIWLLLLSSIILRVTRPAEDRLTRSQRQ
ncbi:TIR domain-containing protein [Oculatella sp. LEGE 06141]|uniref:TIR domain-containing protein n=1 Tax=Oculatella sp. LEGE 06141 TaxID=1828648 RepID=UPI00188169EC|nr:TIR domain-containing protein [Oculatella sp. LEGE 06141]MBE9177802.1 TIR domain-containing protein [Oculatella sp. LEGE 06141]